MHGLIVLSGPPGTGKTTLARGLANEVGKALGKVTYVQLDAHALGACPSNRIFEASVLYTVHGIAQ